MTFHKLYDFAFHVCLQPTWNWTLYNIFHIWIHNCSNTIYWKSHFCLADLYILCINMNISMSGLSLLFDLTLIIRPLIHQKTVQRQWKNKPWNERFIYNTYSKESVFRIHRKLLQIKKNNGNPTEKRANNLNRHFTERKSI